MGLHLSGPVVTMLINYYRGTFQNELKVLPFTGMYWIHCVVTYFKNNTNCTYIFLDRSYPIDSDSWYALSVAYLANILYGMHIITTTSCITTFFSGLCLNMMAYLDDLGKQFTDLDMKYERFGAVEEAMRRQGRERFLHFEINKCIKAHYKIQQ